jgi:hypothetical protein
MPFPNNLVFLENKVSRPIIMYAIMKMIKNWYPVKGYQLVGVVSPGNFLFNL